MTAHYLESMPELPSARSQSCRGAAHKRHFDFVESLGLGPAVEVVETDSWLLVRLNVPGRREQDLDVTSTPSVLTIRAWSTQDKPGFSRKIGLPQGARVDRALARLINGVLCVDVPLETAGLTVGLEALSAV